MNQRTFYLAGVKFHNLKDVIADLKPGSGFELVSEPSNPYDPNAVRVEFKGTMCGYVPARFSSEIAAALSIGKNLVCKVTKVDPSAKPWEQCEVVIEEEENA